MLSDAMMLAIGTAVARWFELAGIVAVVVGSLLALGRLTAQLVGAAEVDRVSGRRDPIPGFRKSLGRSILTGLELLVAADIIRTVAIEPTLQSVLVLGMIVLIRTFLSMSLEVEIEGKWPWRRGEGK